MDAPFFGGIGCILGRFYRALRLFRRPCFHGRAEYGFAARLCSPRRMACASIRRAALAIARMRRYAKAFVGMSGGISKNRHGNLNKILILFKFIEFMSL